MTRDPWYPGGPPQTGPDFAKAREGLDAMDRKSTTPCGEAREDEVVNYLAVRATLDQAEKEIARLRRELDAAKIVIADDSINRTMLTQAEEEIHEMRGELARLRSSPPEEQTQRVTPDDVAGAFQRIEDQFGAFTDGGDAMNEDDFDLLRSWLGIAPPQEPTEEGFIANLEAPAEGFREASRGSPPSPPPTKG